MQGITRLVSPFKILDSVVCFIQVQMVHKREVVRIRDEMLSHNPMYTQAGFSILLSKLNTMIPIKCR